MFDFNVFCDDWKTRAGYETQQEAEQAAQEIVLEHGVTAYVEDDRRDTFLYGYCLGRDEQGADEATLLLPDGSFFPVLSPRLPDGLGPDEMGRDAYRAMR